MIHSLPLLLLWLSTCLAQEVCDAKFAACRHEVKSLYQTASLQMGREGDWWVAGRRWHFMGLQMWHPRPVSTPVSHSKSAADPDVNLLCLLQKQSVKKRVSKSFFYGEVKKLSDIKFSWVFGMGISLILMSFPENKPLFRCSQCSEWSLRISDLICQSVGWLVRIPSTGRISIPGLISHHFGGKPYEEKVLNMFWFWLIIACIGKWYTLQSLAVVEAVSSGDGWWWGGSRGPAHTLVPRKPQCLRSEGDAHAGTVHHPRLSPAWTLACGLERSRFG